MEYYCRSISDVALEDGRSYVGIFKRGDEYSVLTPYGFSLSEIIKTNDRKGIDLLKKYARCITKALSEDKTRKAVMEHTGGKYNPLSALEIVVDYIQNGPYKERETELLIRQEGKIDFKRTLKRIRPQIVKDEAVYTEFAVSKKKLQEQEIVSIAQGNVINHFMENGGEVLFGNFLRVSVPKIKLDGSLVAKLRQVKANSFNSRKQQLIKWIIDYILGAVTTAERGKWNYSIVASTLWEEMIDGCYSNQRSRNKALYGRIFTMYTTGKAVVKSAPTQHDTIYENDRNIVIIDAKMYKRAEQLVNSEVLEKQFGYYQKAKKDKPEKNVFNVLIKPYVPDADYCTGFVGWIPCPDFNADKNNVILVYAVEFEKIMKAYLAGVKLSSFLIEEIIEYMR